MMNYSDFLNQQVINKNNETGIVLSFDKEHVVIKYQSSEKVYNSDIAFKSGFLTFTDERLNNLVTQDLVNKEEISQRQEEEIAKNHQSYLLRRKKVNETYLRLCQKNRMLLSLFGTDFIYPPLKEFEKKYKLLINKRHHYSSILTDYYY